MAEFFLFRPLIIPPDQLATSVVLASEVFHLTL